jgi:hypothetical protein
MMLPGCGRRVPVSWRSGENPAARHEYDSAAVQPDTKLEQRVVTAAERILAVRKSVSALDVLSGIGWLPPNVVEHWQQGRIPDLSVALTMKPEKLAFALDAFQRWARRTDLEPTEVAPLSATRDRRPLQVLPGAGPDVERLFRTHWTQPGLSEARRRQVQARQAKVPDLVVLSPVSEWTCATCGGTGELLYMEADEPHCLDCVDLDHLVFLPAGDAALTRRAKKGSKLSAVVVRFNRSRKRYERQGILVEEAALRLAEEQCLADEDIRSRRRERDRERRAAEDVEFTARFQEQITRQFPGCPAERAEAIARHASVRGSGRVGRSAAGRALDEQAVLLAVVASIRHEDTGYDELLMSGVDRQEARDRIRADIDRVLERWRNERHHQPGAS